MVSDKLYLEEMNKTHSRQTHGASYSQFAEHKDTAEHPVVKFESLETGHVWVLAECYQRNMGTGPRRGGRRQAVLA